MSDKDNANGKGTEASIEEQFANLTEEHLQQEFEAAARGGEGWWEERSLPAKIIMGIGFGILGVIFVALMILLTMTVWNRIMPAVFNLPVLTYWQTLGLLFLSFVFFHRTGGSRDCSRSERKRKRQLRAAMGGKAERNR